MTQLEEDNFMAVKKQCEQCTVKYTTQQQNFPVAFEVWPELKWIIFAQCIDYRLRYLPNVDILTIRMHLNIQYLLYIYRTLDSMCLVLTLNGNLKNSLEKVTWIGFMQTGSFIICLLCMRLYFDTKLLFLINFQSTYDGKHFSIENTYSYTLGWSCYLISVSTLTNLKT